MLHFAEHVCQEQHLAVAGAGDQRIFRVVGVVDDEAGIVHVLFAAHAFKVGLPAFAVGRVGEHEIKIHCRPSIVGEGGVLGAAYYVVGVFAFAFEQQIGDADGVGFLIDLLAEEMDGDIFVALGGQAFEGVFGEGEHTACAACAIVDEICGGLDLVGYRQEDQVGH